MGTLMGRLHQWMKVFRYFVLLNAAVVIGVVLCFLLMGVGYARNDYPLFTNAFFAGLCLMSFAFGLTAFNYSFAGVSFITETVLVVLSVLTTAFTALSVRSWMFVGTNFVLRTAGLALSFAGVLFGLAGWWKLGRELGILREEEEGD